MGNITLQWLKQNQSVELNLLPERCLMNLSSLAKLLTQHTQVLRLILNVPALNIASPLVLSFCWRGCGGAGVVLKVWCAGVVFLFEGLVYTLLNGELVPRASTAAGAGIILQTVTYGGNAMLYHIAHQLT